MEKGRSLKAIIISIAAMLMPVAAAAQTETRWTVGMDLVSKHLWRGLEKAGASLQPMVRFESGGFIGEVFGSQSFSRDAHTNITPQELDIKAVYLFPFGLNVGVCDYWSNAQVVENQYFLFKEKTTGHKLELNLGYSNSYFTLQAFTIVWGNDFKISGSRAFSTYIEAAVPFRLVNLDWTATAGITPMASSGVLTTTYKPNGEELGARKDYLYADQFSCVLLSLKANKTFPLGKVRFPVGCEFYANPYLGTAGMMGSVGIQF